MNLARLEKLKTAGGEHKRPPLPSPLLLWGRRGSHGALFVARSKPEPFDWSAPGLGRSNMILPAAWRKPTVRLACGRSPFGEQCRRGKNRVMKLATLLRPRPGALRDDIVPAKGRPPASDKSLWQ